jgi:hypothetical protein
MILYLENWAFFTPVLVGIKSLIDFFCLKNSIPSRIISLESLYGSKYNALGLICLYFYIRNIHPISSWTLSFKTLIFIASFHGSSLLHTRATTYGLSL